MDGYRRLGGKNGVFASRNSTSFFALVLLVIFFAMVYLYYSASNQASALSRELDLQSEHISKLKNEILESNVNLEKSRTAETACHNAKQIVDTKFDECSTERDKFKAKISDIETSVSEKEESIKSLKKDLAEKADAIETDQAKANAMAKAGVGQEAVILKLNETLELLKIDLALKDNLIHNLRTKLNLTDTAEEIPKSEAQVESKSNSTTLSAQSNTANGVLVEPNRPDEPEHLTAKDFDAVDSKPPPVEEAEPKINEPGKPDDDNNQETAEKADAQKEVRNENGDFLGVREPGMRLKMEEAQQKEENKNNEDNQSHLIDVAKNDDNI